MKLVLILCFLSEICLGQTNAVRIFTTNYVAAASNFREVNGQLYNINFSQVWESLRCKYQNQFGDLAVFQKIERVKIGERPAPQPTLDNSGLIQSYSVPTTFDRNIYADKDGAFILLKNFPDARLVTGQELTPRLMRVGETNFNGSVIAIYDCGKPHFVPVISSKLIKLP